MVVRLEIHFSYPPPPDATIIEDFGSKTLSFLVLEEFNAPEKNGVEITLEGINYSHLKLNLDQISPLDFPQPDTLRSIVVLTPKRLKQICNFSHRIIHRTPIDSFFVISNIAKAMIFKGKFSEVINIITMNPNPGFIYIENPILKRKWFRLDTTDQMPSLVFESRIENSDYFPIVSFRIKDR